MSVHTNVQKFVACLVGPVQAVEDAYQQIIAMKDVDTSIGVHLRGLGKLVGLPTNGIADDEIYRRHVRAQIATNKSDGNIDELIRIAELVVYDDDAEYVVDNQGAAALVLRIEDIATPAEVARALISFLRRAVKGGVRIILEWWPSPGPQMFRFAPVSGASSGKGWGSANDPLVGGKLAGAAE